MNFFKALINVSFCICISAVIQTQTSNHGKKYTNKQTNLDELCFLIRGTVEAMLTIAFHSRRHSCSVYTRPNKAFIIVCCRCQRRQSECRAGPLLRNECKARLKFNNRSWKPQIPRKK